eukprot:6197974-Pleurochrysis_carterae.AAC.3
MSTEPALNEPLLDAASIFNFSSMYGIEENEVRGRAGNDQEIIGLYAHTFCSELLTRCRAGRVSSCRLTQSQWKLYVRSDCRKDGEPRRTPPQSVQPAWRVQTIHLAALQVPQETVQRICMIPKTA